MVTSVIRLEPRILAAFAVIYVVWGSTFLAIRVAIESFAPFQMMGVRSVVAGAVLYVWGRAQGGEGLTGAQWRTAAVLGGLFFVGGHGALAWGETRIPSGVASLLIATIPVWMSLLEIGSGGARPNRRLALGLALGFGGIALLAEPSDLLRGDAVDPLGASVLVAGAFSWAAGSIVSRGADVPRSSVLASGANLLAGGSMLLVLSAATGESATPDVSARSAAALAYLIVFGSILGFAAYVWLLRVVSASKVSTYAFVNPAIAVLLGALAGGEELSPRVLVAAALMVSGVAFLVTQRRPS